MSAAVSSPTSRAEDSLLPSGPPQPPGLVSDSDIQGGVQPNSAHVDLSVSIMDTVRGNSDDGDDVDSDLPAAPGTISDEGSNPSGEPGDVVMEGTAEPEERSEPSASEQASGERESRIVADTGVPASDDRTQETAAERSGTANDGGQIDDDEGDDDDSDAGSEYEHRFFLESFQEDTSTPTEDEKPEMQRRQADEISALDQDHWVKQCFTHLGSNSDPEYEILPELHRLEWTMTPWHGTKNSPNRESFSLSPTIAVTNHDGRKYSFGLKIFPHGNDGTEMVSVYLECSPDNVRPQTPADPEASGSDGLTIPWWEITAQVGCVMYNPKEPRVHAWQKTAHQFTTRHPDFGWTRFAGPWSEIHRRKHLAHAPLLQDDQIAFVVYIRLIKDSTGALWHHPLHDRENDWDPVLKTGYRGLHVAAQPIGYSAIISALAVWFEIPTFRALLESHTPFNALNRPFEKSRILLDALRSVLYDKQAPRWSIDPNKQITYLDSVYTALVKYGHSNLVNPLDVWSAIQKTLHLELADLTTDDHNTVSKLISFFNSHMIVRYCREPIFPSCQDLDDADGHMNDEVKEMLMPASAQEVVSQAAIGDILPEILHLELPRQTYDPERRKWKKVVSKIEINDIVSFRGSEYQLFGLITHSGELGNWRYNPILRPRGPGTQWLRWSTRCNTTSRGVVIPQTYRQAVETNQQATGTSVTLAYLLTYVRKQSFEIMVRDLSEREQHNIYNPLSNAALKDEAETADSEVAVHVTSNFVDFKSTEGFIDPWTLNSGDVSVRLSKTSTIADLRDRLEDASGFAGKQFGLFRLYFDDINHRNHPYVRQERFENRVYHGGEATYGSHFLAHFYDGEIAEAAKKQQDEIRQEKLDDSSRVVEIDAKDVIAAREALLQPARAESVQESADNVSQAISEHVAPEGAAYSSQDSSQTANHQEEEDVVMSGTEEADRATPPAPELPAPDDPGQSTPRAQPAQLDEQMRQDDRRTVEPQLPTDGQQTQGGAKQPASEPDLETKANQLLDALEVDGKGPVQIYNFLSDAGKELAAKRLRRPLSAEEVLSTFAARYANDKYIHYFGLSGDAPINGTKIGGLSLLRFEHLKADIITFQEPHDHVLIFVKHYFPGKGPGKGPVLTPADVVMVKRDGALKDVVRRPNSNNDTRFYVQLPSGVLRTLQGDLNFTQNDVTSGSVIITDPIMPELMATTLTKRGLPTSVGDFLRPQAGFTSGFGRGWASCEVQNGRAHGHGKVIYPDGDAYDGTFVSGRRQGKGTMYYTGGNSYKGDWKDNEPNGRGVVVYAQTNNKYEGPFQAGRPHGSGGITYWKKAEAGARICRICMEDEMNAVLVPCGHLVVCVGCGGHLQECPVCRTGVDKVQRMYDCSQT